MPGLRRVVLDPNVLVSAALTRSGATGELLVLIETEALVPILSPALLGELRRVLRRDKFRRYVTAEEARDYVARLELLGQLADDPSERPPVTADPKDDYLVALARSAKADALVSGDPDLTELDLPDLQVLTPRQLLDELQP